MGKFKLMTPVLFFALIVGCLPQQNEDNGGNDRYYENRKNEDGDRLYILSSSKTRRSGNICEEEEDRNH